MIFTATSLAVNQPTSDRFKQYGANNLAPGRISECKVTAFAAAKYPAVYISVLGSFYAYVAATALSSTVDPLIMINIFAMLPPQSYSMFFPLPQMVVSLRKKNETAVGRLNALGFTQQSHGKYQFYSGPSTTEAIRDVVMINGVEPDAYAPRGFASVHGNMALMIINRVLFYAFATCFDLPNLTTEYSPSSSIFAGFVITENNIGSLKDQGQFLPYFDGLLHPDPSTITCFIRRFSFLLGASGVTIADNVETLMSGWSSAASTSAGRAISHAMFCIEQALTSCVAVQPVIIRGEYSGCLFTGKVAFTVGPKKQLPVKANILIEELSSLLSHEDALSKIAAIITRDETPVTPESLTSPRSIHLRIKAVKLTPAEAVSLRQHMKRLKFRQTYWSVADNLKCLAVIRAIVHKEDLPADAPILCPSDAMFTSDTTLAGLAAFGALALSLNGVGTVVSRSFAKEMYSGINKPGTLIGIPYFAKPLQEAYEDWTRMLKDHAVHFSHAGKDKMGRLRIKGVDGYIPLDSAPAKEILEILIAHASDKGKKRRREDAEEEVSTVVVVDEEARKKRRLKGYGMMFAGATHPEGVAAEAGGSHDADMDDDDLFA